MAYQLVVVRGRSASSALKLADGITTVGRQDDCQLRIASSQVSRRHCQLFEKEGYLLVKDLGSSNGTYVNGKKIEGQQVLEPGNMLTIGPVKFRVEKVGEPAPASKAGPAHKPGDTAIAEAALGLEAEEPAPEDEFEIDFDSEPAGAAPSASAPKTEPPPLAGKPQPAAKDQPQPKAKAAEPKAAMAEDAVADFLLSIDLDDEDKR
jgi:predicted component of type VI protein secretion system